MKLIICVEFRGVFKAINNLEMELIICAEFKNVFNTFLLPSNPSQDTFPVNVWDYFLFKKSLIIFKGILRTMLI